MRYFEKPPLTDWLTAASIKVLGRNELAVRAPAALASAGTVAVTAALGEAMFGTATGLLAAIAIASSPLFFIFARFATPDPALTVFFTAALAAFFLAARKRDFGDGAGRNLMIVASVALALGTLAKGPVTLLLGGGIGLIWILVERRAKAISRIRWLECATIYLVIVAPWFILAARRNSGFLSFFFVHEHLQRFVSSTEHGWGPWFFVPMVVAGSWPWFYFAFYGAAEVWVSPVANEGLGRRGAARFLFIWFAVVFVFFSIPRSKLGEYILPAMPPIAILAGLGLERVRSMELSRARHLLGWFALANLAWLAGAGAIELAWLSGRLGPVKGFAVLARDAVMLMAVWGIGAAGIYVTTRRTRSAGSLPWGITLVAVISAAILVKARVDATPAVSYRELASTI
ncbi:MAG: ArnT family glycosyltransferase, partial [Candidatus Binataceae bacterium]